MKPIRLELDHFRKEPPPATASWILLAVAVAFVGSVGVVYFKVRSEFETKSAQLAELSRTRLSSDAKTRVTSRPVSPEEFAAARDTIVSLSMPWNNVFGALESARNNDVGLLSIEPDPASGTVSITGEAKSYTALLTYVAWLSSAKTLKEVYLTKHEFREDDPRRPVAFTVSANWNASR